MRIELIAKPRFLPTKEMQVEAREDQLIGEDAEQLIEVAGRVCYDSLGTGRNSKDYHGHLLDSGHGSVLEHSQFSFLVSGVSRSLTHELVRHRVGVAISQRSTRYCNEYNTTVVHHPLIKMWLSDDKVDDLDKRYWEANQKDCERMNRELYLMTFNIIRKYLESKGVEKSTSIKQARGAARQYLENGLPTELVWSANIRTLRHVIAMRGHSSADMEIRNFAVGLAEIMAVHCPAYFSDCVIEELPHGMGKSARVSRV